MLKQLRTKPLCFYSIFYSLSPSLQGKKLTNPEDLSISGMTSVSSADKCKLTLDISEEDR